LPIWHFGNPCSLTSSGWNNRSERRHPGGYRWVAWPHTPNPTTLSTLLSRHFGSCFRVRIDRSRGNYYNWRCSPCAIIFSMQTTLTRLRWGSSQQTPAPLSPWWRGLLGNWLNWSQSPTWPVSAISVSRAWWTTMRIIAMSVVDGTNGA